MEQIGDKIVVLNYCVQGQLNQISIVEDKAQKLESRYHINMGGRLWRVWRRNNAGRQ